MKVLILVLMILFVFVRSDDNKKKSAIQGTTPYFDKNIKVLGQDKVAVYLISNTAKGFKWRFHQTPRSKNVELITETTIDKKSPFRNKLIEKVQVFVFKVISSKKSLLEFWYMKRRDKTPTHKYKILVKIK